MPGRPGARTQAALTPCSQLHASAMHSGHKDDLRELVEGMLTFGVDGQQIPAVRQLCEAYEQAALEDSLDNDEQVSGAGGARDRTTDVRGRSTAISTTSLTRSLIASH